MRSPSPSLLHGQSTRNQTYNLLSTLWVDSYEMISIRAIGRVATQFLRKRPYRLQGPILSRSTWELPTGNLARRFAKGVSANRRYRAGRARMAASFELLRRSL